MAAPDYANLAVEVWKKIVEVQQHFNQIEMTVRNWAVTLFVAVIGAAGLAVEKGLVLSAFKTDVPLATILLASGALAWAAFFFMEYYWYHVFLRAAGEQAGIVEAAWRTFLPEMGLSTKISAKSAVPILGVTLTSSKRLSLFYLLGIAILAVLSAASIGAHGPAPTPTARANEAIAAELARTAASLATTASRLAEAAASLPRGGAAAAPTPVAQCGARPAPRRRVQADPKKDQDEDRPH